ncbi:MAG: hypothetical protein KA313_07730 [Pseudarcicella sp.]|nr:hypothetical protein [Pseudarcicella sp.]
MSLIVLFGDISNIYNHTLSKFISLQISFVTVDSYEFSLKYENNFRNCMCFKMGSLLRVFVAYGNENYYFVSLNHKKKPLMILKGS